MGHGVPSAEVKCESLNEEDPMFRRKAVLSLVGAVFLLASCDQEATNPLAPSEGPSAEKTLVDMRSQGMVPISWSFKVSATGDSWVPCYLPNGEPFVFGGEPVYVGGTYSVEGTLSHVGRLREPESLATIHACQVGLDATGMPETISGPVTAHLAGPQGDAIELEGTLTNWIFAGYARGDWDIVGGAGRFHSANGYLDTVEHPAQDGSGSVGKGSGMITAPQPMADGRDH
jgi:hypothetical protein